ncbi:MAG TPA: hypothetical protein VK842_07360, partial [bacterium]|nr:hypothetical protein [bacterium]
WRNGDLALVPNPVHTHAAALISYRLPSEGEPILALFSLDGGRVASWQPGEQPAGEGQVRVQLEQAPGVYILALTESMDGHTVLVATFKVAILP